MGRKSAKYGQEVSKYGAAPLAVREHGADLLTIIVLLPPRSRAAALVTCDCEIDLPAKRLEHLAPCDEIHGHAVGVDNLMHG